jgi:hypothetical protein
MPSGRSIGPAVQPGAALALPLAGLGRALRLTKEAPHARRPAPGLEAPGAEAAGWRDLFEFINKELLPHLHGLDVLPDGLPNPAASPKQRVIGRIMTAVERVRVDSETNLCDILDRVHEISIDHIDDTALLHPVAGVRGPAAEDGREELRRRPVLHPARGGPRHGAHAGPAVGRDGVRPLLRHRRLSGPGLRADAPQLGDARASTDIER